MKRYEIIRQWHTTMFEAEDGDWLKYEDVKKMVIEIFNKLGAGSLREQPAETLIKNS